MMRVPSAIRAVWEEYGLITGAGRAGARLSVGGPHARAAAFRSACERLGGCFQAFAVFLSGRADLLPPAYLEELRAVSAPFLGGDATASIERLKTEVLRLTEIGGSLFSRNFTAEFQSRPVSIEVFSPVDLTARRTRFELGLSALSGFPESGITHQEVLEDFQSWLSLHADVERKRLMLRNLRQASSAWVTWVPPLIPELEGATVLAYERAGSDPTRSTALDEPGFRLSLESLMEQMLILSFIPADAALPELVPAGEGRMGYRVWPFMEPVPIRHHQPLTQYLASSVAEDTGRAVRMLLRMTRRREDSGREPDFWNALSGLRFEAASASQPPESVARLLRFWRASTASGNTPAPFLHLLHRQLALAAGSRAAEGDWLPGALWPVMLRLVRHRLAESVSGGSTQDWALGSGMLALGMFRQLGTLLEQIRDNDLSITVTTSSDAGESDEKSGRFLRGVVPVVVFAASLQLAVTFAGTVPGVVSGIVSLLSGALFVRVAARG